MNVAVTKLPNWLIDSISLDNFGNSFDPKVSKESKEKWLYQILENIPVNIQRTSSRSQEVDENVPVEKGIVFTDLKTIRFYRTSLINVQFVMKTALFQSSFILPSDVNLSPEILEQEETRKRSRSTSPVISKIDTGLSLVVQPSQKFVTTDDSVILNRLGEQTSPIEPVKRDIPIEQLKLPLIKIPKGVGLIKLPKFSTILKVQQIDVNKILNIETTGKSVVHTQKQASLDVLKNIDISRLTPGRAKKNDPRSITVAELKDWSRQLGLPITGSKEQLIENIRNSHKDLA